MLDVLLISQTFTFFDVGSRKLLGSLWEDDAEEKQNVSDAT